MRKKNLEKRIKDGIREKKEILEEEEKKKNCLYIEIEKKQEELYELKKKI
jgi:hypothetical protein